ncbi:hypothetical protein B0A55_03036 [Friedmanniomyces simplex]|uniref:Uncharacterized protein n=1 Tax=Friedmanniomyces simplex TaxID=329884 RepID=A0A4U0XRJ5_9PEZI|nr:hypothetical protein B0A55_03036 [Friedmanniomyces simplex]
MDAVKGAITGRDLDMPWQYVKDWNPIKIDALGLVTLLGAEEVGRAVGSLEKRRFTEYLPLLGALVIAGERFLDQQLGYNLYVINDGVQTTQLNGWFTRWAAAQKTKDATTIFRWRVAGKTSLVSAWDYLAMAISLLVVMPLLPCTALVGDWWGVANWAAITLSIWVRVALLWPIRTSLEPHCAPHETKKGWELEHLPGEDEIKILVVRPDGRMFTILTMRDFLPAFSRRVLSEPPKRYKIAAYVGWLAFGVHACTLGMCTLMTQIYTMVLLVASTWLYVKRFDADIQGKSHTSADWGGGTSIGDAECEVITTRPFGNGIEVQQINTGDRLDRRMHAYARLQLDVEQETLLKEWHMLPVHSGLTKSWYESYGRAKSDFVRWVEKHEAKVLLLWLRRPRQRRQRYGDGTATL